jgi:hypothetical protein
MYTGLYVKYPLFLSGFNGTGMFSTHYGKILKYQILWKYVHSVQSCLMRTDRQAYLLSYLLTPWIRDLLEKLTGLQLVNKFPAFYGTRRFINTFTSARHLSLSWASSIQSIPPHPTSWRSVLILSSHLRLGLSSGLVPSGFPVKTL